MTAPATIASVADELAEVAELCRGIASDLGNLAMRLSGIEGDLDELKDLVLIVSAFVDPDA